MRDYDEKTTCCFTGHRILKKDFDETKITSEIEGLIKKGYRTFLVGMALGFDSLVFEKLLNFKNYNIDVIACVPCREQDKYFSTAEKEKYIKYLKKADKVVYVSEEYSKGCMQKRNRYMVDNSQVVVAYLYSKTGGTYYTVNYAIKKEKEVLYI